MTGNGSRHGCSGCSAPGKRAASDRKHQPPPRRGQVRTTSAAPKGSSLPSEAPEHAVPSVSAAPLFRGTDFQSVLLTWTDRRFVLASYPCRRGRRCRADFCGRAWRGGDLEPGDVDPIEAREWHYVEAVDRARIIALLPASGKHKWFQAAMLVIEQGPDSLPGLRDLPLIDRGQVKGHGL